MTASIRAWARRLKRDVVAVYLAIRDPRTPWYARALGAVVVAYALSPIDLIPDFIPVLGYLDDVLLVPLGVWFVLRLIPLEVMTAARSRADDQLAKGKPTSWAGAAFVVGIWLLVAGAGIAWWIRSG